MTVTIDPVLIVDDHADTRDLLRELLELEGFTVLAAASGAEALAIAGEVRPCLVILDLGLPDIDGLELVLQLRGEQHTANAPIYALSGFTNLRAAALAAGIDGFLVKPVSGSDLRLLVEQHCSTAPPEKQPRPIGPPPVA
jgi:DNA-binding response OmpR family regulator